MEKRIAGSEGASTFDLLGLAPGLGSRDPEEEMCSVVNVMVLSTVLVPYLVFVCLWYLLL